jgi:putative PIN family toxin of toxin-antitoxin system
MRAVLDTNIIVGAMLSGGGATREILRLSLEHQITPLIGVALFSEMQDVLSRGSLFQKCLLDSAERDELFRAFLSCTEWTPIYYSWRPNLRDEADNHIVDLAVAGNATYIVTQNERDFQKMDLLFPDLEIVNAADFLAIWRTL